MRKDFYVDTINEKTRAGQKVVLRILELYGDLVVEQVRTSGSARIRGLGCIHASQSVPGRLHVKASASTKAKLTHDSQR